MNPLNCVLAFDWDGVVESPRTAMFGAADPVVMHFLTRMARHGFKLLFTGTKRTQFDDVEHFIRWMGVEHGTKFYGGEFCQNWRTSNKRGPRADEINGWLAENKPVDFMLVLDDERVEGLTCPNYQAKCSTTDGFTSETALDLCRTFGNDITAWHTELEEAALRIYFEMESALGRVIQQRLKPGERAARLNYALAKAHNLSVKFPSVRNVCEISLEPSFLDYNLHPKLSEAIVHHQKRFINAARQSGNLRRPS